MKKLLFIVSILAICIIHIEAKGQTNSNSTNKNLSKKAYKLKGEQIFNKHAEKCLDVMEKTAKDNSVTGVAIICFAPTDTAGSWVSSMRVVGNVANDKANFLAIAGSKAAEMFLTHENSGSKVREPLNGELGYKGGMIKKVKYGYVIASFSGGPSEIDAEISTSGINWLSEFYPSGAF